MSAFTLADEEANGQVAAATYCLPPSPERKVTWPVARLVLTPHAVYQRGYHVGLYCTIFTLFKDELTVFSRPY